jgi:hydroxylamine reductase (hybrid-cluster protein)
VYGPAAPDVTAVNLGVLKPDQVNVVLHGHVAPRTVSLLAKSAAGGPVAVGVAAICGSEISGPLNIPVVTNYDSQEAALLTGTVDLLVVGSQCVMPALVSLAEKLAVPVMNAAELKDAAAANRAVAAATDAFRRRAGKEVSPVAMEEVYAGYTAANSPAIFKALAQGYSQGKVQGLAYLGGCGNLAQTQDMEIIKLAARLIKEGYLVVTAGCAGTALAKAGLCRPEYPGAERLRRVLPDGTPPVLYLGSCHDAGEFPAMAAAVAGSGMPVLAVMPEITHNKVLATAVAFAANGITSFIDFGETDRLPAINLTGKVLPLAEFEQLLPAQAQVAATR